MLRFPMNDKVSFKQVLLGLTIGAAALILGYLILPGGQ